MIITPGALYRFTYDKSGPNFFGQLFIPVNPVEPLSEGVGLVAGEVRPVAYQRWLCMFRESSEILRLWSGHFELAEEG